MVAGTSTCAITILRECKGTVPNQLVVQEPMSSVTRTTVGEVHHPSRRTLVQSFTGVECQVKERHLLSSGTPRTSSATSRQTTRNSGREEVILSAGAFNAASAALKCFRESARERNSNDIVFQCTSNCRGVGAGLGDRCEVGIVYKMEENFSTAAKRRGLKADEQKRRFVYREWKDGVRSGSKTGLFVLQQAT